MHRYQTETIWTGNTGTGTAAYTGYERAHEIRCPGKPAIPASSDPNFRGDAARWNPEELFLSSLSACHMLWYLHLCAEAGIVVKEYKDSAEGFMTDVFTRVILRPSVIVANEQQIDGAMALHHAAHKKCFLANSVNFPVECEPRVEA